MLFDGVPVLPAKNARFLSNFFYTFLNFDNVDIVPFSSHGSKCKIYSIIQLCCYFH